MNLSLAVQHHPARAHLLTPLMERLGGCELVVDPEPDSPVRSALRTYLEALRRTPPHATHRLCIQDDALPCAEFCKLAEAAIAERPEDLIAFFVPGRTLYRRMMAKVHAKGERWWQMPNTNWVPTVALSWPVELAADFVAYGEQITETREHRGLTTQADDPYVGAWRMARKVAVWATVPCLVQHPDVEESLFRPGFKGKAGANRARVAALYVDDCDQPTERLSSVPAGDSAGVQRRRS